MQMVDPVGEITGYRKARRSINAILLQVILQRSNLAEFHQETILVRLFQRAVELDKVRMMMFGKCAVHFKFVTKI